MARAVLAVAFVLVLSGCSGFFGADATESMTPAPVPTDTTVYPPGVSDQRIDPPVLVSAHTSVLASTNYTLSASERIVSPEGDTIYSRSWVQKVGTVNATYTADPRQNVIRYRVGERTSDIEHWTTETETDIRYRDRDGQLQRYWWSTAHEEPLSDLSGRDDIRMLFSTMQLAVVRHGDGRTLLRGTTASNLEQFVTPPPVTDPEIVTVRMVVRYDGVVVFQRVAYDATIDTNPVRVVRETQITDIGSTTVSRPPWMQNATQAADS